MTDLYTPDTVLRLWLLFATVTIALVILAAHLASHAAEKAFRDSAQRHHPTQPNLVPVLPASSGPRNRLSVVCHIETSLASNAQIVGVGGEDEKQTGAA